MNILAKKRELRLARYKKYRENNKEECLRRYYEWLSIPENREKVKANARTRYKKNAEKLRVISSSYNEGWEKGSLRGQPWSDVDECFIMTSGLTIGEISKKIGRSYSAVTKRRSLIKERDSKCTK
jgi:hypothetical protein